MSVSKGKRKAGIIAVSVIIFFAVIVGVCAIYLGDYYRADKEAIEAFLPQGYFWEKEPDGTIIFNPEQTDTGFIFYPGGKVEYDAYIPLMQACSKQGILCALVEMPFNLAVLNVNAAEGIQEQYPQIENWYIGGHSLGGSMAAAYLSKHKERFKGLVLLGAYSTADLSATDLKVLSVYGSEDGVMNRKKYDKNKGNLPLDFTENIIEGGCHAYFGMYGTQDGDGIPTITNEEQIRLTADAIAGMIIPKQSDADNDKQPVLIHVFSEDDMLVYPEIAEYNFETAQEMGNVQKLAGILPGANEGTWYITEIEGIEYYYGKYDTQEEKETVLLGYSIISDKYSLENGISVGMTKEEILSNYPDMAVTDFEGNHLGQEISGYQGWNGISYPRSYKGMDSDWEYGGKDYLWTDQFDYVIIADIDLGESDVLPRYLALLMKDDIIAAITFFNPTAG